MANEWKILVELSPSVGFTCATGTGIEKGTALKCADLNTVSATSDDGDFFVGIATREHEANDGTLIDVCMHCIALVKDSGAGVTVGDPLKINGANLVATADEAGASGPSEVIGFALETAAANNTFRALIRR